MCQKGRGTSATLGPGHDPGEPERCWGSTDASGCKVDAGASNTLIHLLSVEASLFPFPIAAADPGWVLRGSYEPCG